MTCEAGGTDVAVPAIGRVLAGPLVPRYTNVWRQGAASCRGPHRCASILLVPGLRSRGGMQIIMPGRSNHSRDHVPYRKCRKCSLLSDDPQVLQPVSLGEGNVWSNAACWRNTRS